MKRFALIGLGKQNTKDHLLALKACSNTKIVAVCDKDNQVSKKWGDELNVPHYSSAAELVKNEKLDAAIVAVPHSHYFRIIQILAENKINIFKEKPLAISLDEALQIHDIVVRNNINLTIAVQRKFSKIYQTYKEYEKHIGDIFSVHGHYTLDIERLDEGWRASKKLSGGGAVIDMGYHLIDLLIWYFGVPNNISADLGYNNKPEQDYDVEDTAKIQFSYDTPSGRKILGSLLLSRIYPEKEEALTIYGTRGSITIFNDRITHFSPKKEILGSTYLKKNGEDTVMQMQKFVNSLRRSNQPGNLAEHLADMVFIDAIYRSSEAGTTEHPRLDKRYAKALSLAYQGKVAKNVK